MTVVGFNFTKITAQKKGPISGRVDIKNNIAVVGVETTNLSLGTAKQDGLKFDFEFTSDYEPKIGSMLFSGEVLYLGEAKKHTEILASWKKDKKVPEKIMSDLLNTIINRCNIEGILLSRDVNLPPPVRLPKMEMQAEA